MLFLLPPSETKRIGGTPPTIAQVSQTFGVLTETRGLLVDQLVSLSKRPDLARKVLKISERQSFEIELNANLWNAVTMPAIERYSGTLYEAIDAKSLSDQALTRARETVLIQSALFGLICSSDRIPYYRFSASTRLENINLRKIWSKPHETVFQRLASSAPIIDLRSKVYAELAPIPKSIEHYWVEVVSRNARGNVKALNHFNKKAKGELIRAVLLNRKAPSTLKELSGIAKRIGFEIRLSGDLLQLVIPEN